MRCLRCPPWLFWGKKCSRCSTRYCGPACQAQHWKECGHDKLCKKIKKAGGAEKYHAGKKYEEAVAVAVEKCAEDTKGQTCYICTEAVHWKTKEGLVRGCSCRGTAGFAHVSCLAEQAKILIEESEENNLDMNPRWARWYSCSLCKQYHHGVVLCALGWACWKTYLGRPEGDRLRNSAMTVLGEGLSQARQHEDALSVREAELSMGKRLGTSEEDMLLVQSNLAMTYGSLGRFGESLMMEHDVYFAYLKLNGEEHDDTLKAAGNYAVTLRRSSRYKEVKALMCKTMPLARRVLGDLHQTTLMMRSSYAEALSEDNSMLDDLREAVATLEDTVRIARRVLGSPHPLTVQIEGQLQKSRAALRARDTPPPRQGA